nr:MAG TPA: hypothetical protein [Caudoviricetes sp.]DAJ17186.1 MAG TPA: hypothetical protein [Myoviridae sp. ctDOq19]DAX40928.1 MAG TPA: hypothetical protein [Caudoviricetes sp.]
MFHGSFPLYLYVGEMIVSQHILSVILYFA